MLMFILTDPTVKSVLLSLACGYAIVVDERPGPEWLVVSGRLQYSQ